MSPLANFAERPRTARVTALLLSCLTLLTIGVGVQLAQDPPSLNPARQQVNVSTDPDDPYPMPPELVGVDLLGQSAEACAAKSHGCVQCHQGCRDPHFKDTLRIGCTDCHGGCADTNDKAKAHVAPRFPEFWRTSGNPVRTYTLLNHETPEFIRFINPGDFRIAHISCGTSGCHAKEVNQNRKSIMATGCMLWGAALYNNGSVPYKRARHGEAYSMRGAPLRLQTVPPPDEHEMCKKGVVPFLDPLPRFEASQPGNVLRFFEQGGGKKAEVGIPNNKEVPGRPLQRLSERGLGTENRTDPGLVSLNKTRLFDPTLNFLGTNDHPGDFRSSGCSACHVLYANDRSPVNSGPYAAAGNMGTAHGNPDPCIPKDEPGHPIEHRFRSGIPTSQCMVCHIHPGTTVMNSYPGYMWWDEETEGHLMYPKKQKRPTSEELTLAAMRNPDEAAAKGNWSEPKFLNNVVELNAVMSKTQFADFHGHGWVFRAVFRHDREGRLLDRSGCIVPQVTPADLQAAVKVPELAKQVYKQPYADVESLRTAEKAFEDQYKHVPVHYMDIHLEKGMHCVDCHFVQDVHGNTRLQMEVRAACEIQCIDCHGKADQRANLRTSGPASYTSTKDPKLPGRDLTALTTPWGKRRLERVGEKVYQNSMVEEGLRWEVTQVPDTITPGHPRYNAKAHLAKTVRFDGGKMAWGDVPPTGSGQCTAHGNDTMHCIACHSAWNPSCYGCHLPQRANAKMPHLHWDGDVTRNYTPYNFQTLRDEVYMLARDGDVTGNRIGPARSSCAIHVGSYNQNRESIYVQQQTISSEGMSGVAFSTNVPHTVRGRDGTKQCTDCHVSLHNDNNAWMAQLLMHGTNYLNFVGKYAWVACGEHGLNGVVVTERDEPQAVIGSSLHKLAFPEEFARHQKRKGYLEHAHEHPGVDIAQGLINPLKSHEILAVQNRGEYLMAACGEDGVRAFDIAMIDNKAFSERITTAPVSPIGQRFYVKTKNARSLAAPTTTAPDPTRTHRPENREQKVHPLYAYVYVADAEEGLVIIGGIASTINGNPMDNFLKRELTFNPDGCLTGAKSITIFGTYAYICCDAGLVVVDLDDPKKPKITATVGAPFLKGVKAVQAQFRYAYAIDDEGLKVLDVTCLENPQPVSMYRMDGLQGVYLARSYAYVAAGKRGLAIFDIRVADRPRLDQVFDADGVMNDVRDVKLGITYVSEFAYIADGKNGLRVVQLTSPETPGNDGFHPRPTPCLVATYRVPHGGKVLQVAKGLDRDRAVDESGNQIGVFGRVGARPFNKEEQRKLYLHCGQLWTVCDDPTHPMYGLPRIAGPASAGR
ncbi:MAG: hypothetical protein U0746_06565 [Gemmataceae bacterium]